MSRFLPVSAPLAFDPVVQPSTAPSQRLRTTMAAVRFSFTWFGVRKSLTTEQKAEAFGADGGVLSASKRLIYTRHPKYKAVTSIRNRAVSLWKSISLPFPEAGIRLVKQDDSDWIDGQMKTFQGELTQAVAELDEHYRELQSAARPSVRCERLSSQPDGTVRDRVGLAQWRTAGVYRDECQRVQARLDEAVRLAEAIAAERDWLAEHWPQPNRQG